MKLAINTVSNPSVGYTMNITVVHAHHCTVIVCKIPLMWDWGGVKTFDVDTIAPTIIIMPF